MTATIEGLREQIVEEEREVGIRADGHVTPDAIHRRRLQIGGVALLVIAGLLFTTMANDVWQEFRRQSWIDAEAARVALVVFALGFAIYVFDKEQHLKRLDALGHDLERLDLELTRHLLHSAAIAEAIEDVSGTLDLDGVLDRTLRQSLSLAGASAGAVSLLGEHSALRVASLGFGLDDEEDNESMLRFAHTLAREVVLSREPVVTLRRASSVAVIPLIHDGRVLGVLTVVSRPGETLGAPDAELLERFAGPAATAIAHAQHHEAALFLLDQFDRRPA